jgi:hypothetical protein
MRIPRWKLWIRIAILCTGGGTPVIASAVIVPSYGLTFFDQGFAEPYPTGVAQSAPGTNVQNSQQLSYSDSFALSSSTGATSTFSGTIDGTQLHAFSATSGLEGNAYNGADEYWFDTFTFLPGTYSVNLVFDGTLTDSVPGDVADLVDSFSFLENGTVVPGLEYSGIVATLYGQNGTSQQQSVQLSFTSATTIVLGELLQIRNDVVVGGGITIDDSDTAYFTVTPLTSGAGFTTASGLTYAPVSSVPEPSSAVPLSAAMALFFLIGRSQRKGVI